MPQPGHTNRRGAPVPALDLEPPGHLDAEARRAFSEAVASRPRFFTPSDSRLLAAYAIAAAAVRRMERDPSTARDANSYTRAVDLLIRLARTLRLSPISRGAVDASVAPPAEVGPEQPETDTSGASAPWLRSVA
jgi:phage terminase small subunit